MTLLVLELPAAMKQELESMLLERGELFDWKNERLALVLFVQESDSSFTDYGQSKITFRAGELVAAWSKIGIDQRMIYRERGRDVERFLGLLDHAMGRS